MDGIRRWMWVWILSLLLGLQGCSVAQMDIGADGPRRPYVGPVKPGRAPIPGDYFFYSFGPGQSFENFANIKRAQYSYGPFVDVRWREMGPQHRPTANLIGLQVYYPMHVRWELKDGRQFSLRYVDVPKIMREYFETHRIDLQWQRERRSKAAIGDFDAMLAFELQEEILVIKWVITINKLSPSQRLTPEGRAVAYQTNDEQHIVARLPGVSVVDIDFDKILEVAPPNH